MEDEILEFTYKKPQKKRAWDGDWVETTLFVESTTVTDSSRKLKAEWSYEATQDLLSQHNIAQELSDKMLDEMLAEMDRKIIVDLRNSLN